jgi:outer membrane protein assembly factor BamB
MSPRSSRQTTFLHGVISKTALSVLSASCSLFDHDAAGPLDRVRERWTRPQAQFAETIPVIVGDLVIFGTGAGELIARNQTTGEAVWTTPVSADRIASQNLVERQGIAVAGAVRSVHGVDAATGRRLWTYEPPVDSIDMLNPKAGSVDHARLDADESTVFVPAWGASVSAVDLRTGAARWIWQPVGTSHRTGSMGVRVSGDTVLATVWHFLNTTGTQSESWVVALEKSTGRELWRVVLPAPGYLVGIQCAPALWGRLAIVNTSNGQVFAIDRFTRAVAWQTAVVDTRGAGLNATDAEPLVLGDVVYHDAGSGDLWARNASDGHLLWKSRYGAQLVGDLTASERRVYGNAYGYLFVFDRSSGRLVASIQQPNSSDPFIASAPIARGRQLFVNVGGAAWSFDEP